MNLIVNLRCGFQEEFVTNKIISPYSNTKIMSGASNYGYGNIVPNSNVNPNYVNVTGSNYPGGFGSDIIPKSSHSCQSPPNNIVAASGTWTGNGGRKNIHKVYKKMKVAKRKSVQSKKLRKFRKSGKRKTRVKKTRKSTGKRRIKTRKSLKVRKGKKKGKKSFKLKKKHLMRGGTYTQYQSNVPYTPGYAVAGVNVAPNMSATANPPPIEIYNNCKDNYNHYEATK